jgi:hypothetical protein
VEVFGECQAMLFNLEEFLTREFGAKAAINQRLAFALQFSKTLTTEQQESLKTLTRPLAANVKAYLDTFRSSLSDSVFEDPQFSQRYFLLPNLGNHLSRDTVAIQWVPYDESNPESMKLHETIATIVKTKHVPVANTGGMKPGQVVDAVASALYPRRFNTYHHTQAWKYFKVRPATGRGQPEICDAKYCHYDAVHKDYVYTPAWVQKLSLELADEDTYLAVCRHGKPGVQTESHPVAS